MASIAQNFAKVLNSAFLLLKLLSKHLLLEFHFLKQQHFCPLFAHFKLFFYDELDFTLEFNLRLTKIVQGILLLLDLVFYLAPKEYTTVPVVYKDVVNFEYGHFILAN